MVKKQKDFQKVKLKVGRKIKKQNETVVNIKRKKIILPKDTILTKNYSVEKHENQLLDELIEDLNCPDCNVILKALESIFAILKPFAEQFSECHNEEQGRVIDDSLFGSQISLGQFAFQPGNLIGNLLRVARTKEDKRLGSALSRISMLLFKLLGIKHSKFSASRELFEIALAMFNRSEMYYKWSSLELTASLSHFLLMDSCSISKYLIGNVVYKMLCTLVDALAQMPDTELAEERRFLYLTKSAQILPHLFDISWNCHDIISNPIPKFNHEEKLYSLKPEFALNFGQEQTAVFTRPEESKDYMTNLQRQTLLLCIRILEDFTHSASEYNMKRIYWSIYSLIQLIIDDHHNVFAIKKNPKDKNPLIHRVLKTLINVTPLRNCNASNSFRDPDPVKPGIIILTADMSKKKKKLAQKQAQKLERRNKITEKPGITTDNLYDTKMIPLAHIVNQTIIKLKSTCILTCNDILTDPSFDCWQSCLQAALFDDSVSSWILWAWLDCFDSVLLSPIRSRTLLECLQNQSCVRLFEFTIGILAQIVENYVNRPASEMSKPLKSNRYFLKALGILGCFGRNVLIFNGDSILLNRISKTAKCVEESLLCSTENATVIAALKIDQYEYPSDCMYFPDWATGKYSTFEATKLDSKSINQTVL